MIAGCYWVNPIHIICGAKSPGKRKYSAVYRHAFASFLPISANSGNEKPFLCTGHCHIKHPKLLAPFLYRILPCQKRTIKSVFLRTLFHIYKVKPQAKPRRNNYLLGISTKFSSASGKKNYWKFQTLALVNRHYRDFSIG